MEVLIFKKWYPQIIHFNGIFPYKPSIFGYPHLWKPQYIILYQPKLNSKFYKGVKTSQKRTWCHQVTTVTLMAPGDGLKTSMSRPHKIAYNVGPVMSAVYTFTINLMNYSYYL